MFDLFLIMIGCIAFIVLLYCNYRLALSEVPFYRDTITRIFQFGVLVLVCIFFISFW